MQPKCVECEDKGGGKQGADKHKQKAKRGDKGAKPGGPRDAAFAGEPAAAHDADAAADGDGVALGACTTCGGAPGQTKAAGAAPLGATANASGITQLHPAPTVAAAQLEVPSAAGDIVQRWPGDGMVPPGDCGWARYTVLRGAVESAKAVVSSLGACTTSDTCELLAVKIAAIVAEISARVALDSTCFRGGDTGHRQQVQDKVSAHLQIRVPGSAEW